MVDAIGWYVCIAVLWVHGETHFPPGDVPLVVAISGRPAIALIGAATFNLANRRRLAAWAAAAGLFHVSLGLGELRRDEIRSVMGYTGRGAPSACGNESTTASSTVEDYESEAFAPRSHYTTKVSGPPHEVIDATWLPPRRRPEAASTGTLSEVAQVCSQAGVRGEKSLEAALAIPDIPSLINQ